MGAFNLSSMQKVFDAANYCAINSLPSIVVLNRAVVSFAEQNDHTYQHILNTDVAAMTEIDKQIKIQREAFEKAMKDYEPLLSDDKDKKMLADDRAALAALDIVRDKILDLSRQNKNSEARDLVMKELRPLADKLNSLLDAHMQYNVELSDKGSKDALATNKQARIVSLAVILLIAVTVILFTLGIAQAITRPIAACVTAADRIAEGDLTVQITADTKDETGQLQSAMKKMVDTLRDMATRLTDLSSGVASASNQLQTTAEQIATGAEEVASQSNTVATASEEMSHTSSDIARNCLLAAEASRQTTQSATSGSAIVQETINGMALIAERVRDTASTVEALGARSQQIGQIVGTIEDIADQTNLLALNAAIEAARAGEQGRGFAVVADEVRALAERTTKATREIGDMIKAIQKETGTAVKAMEEGVYEVEKGAETSQKSGHALQDILERINEVTMQVNQIATAAEEQTATTGEVSSNILQITEVVQQTARGADETASAAAQLAKQAQQLQELVRRFRL